jgi:hypothetical protein
LRNSRQVAEFDAETTKLATAGDFRLRHDIAKERRIRLAHRRVAGGGIVRPQHRHFLGFSRRTARRDNRRPVAPHHGGTGTLATDTGALALRRHDHPIIVGLSVRDRLAPPLQRHGIVRTDSVDDGLITNTFGDIRVLLLGQPDDIALVRPEAELLIHVDAFGRDGCLASPG